MLFVVVQTHSHEHCSAHKPESVARIRQAMSAAAPAGVKIVGSYIDTLGHTNFMIVETDSVEKLQQFFDPLLDFWNADVHPVIDTATALARLQEQH